MEHDEDEPVYDDYEDEDDDEDEDESVIPPEDKDE
jgi:hypothetical protein